MTDTSKTHYIGSLVIVWLQHTKEKNTSEKLSSIMKTTTNLVIALLTFGFFAHQAEATISITNFNLTTNSLSFDISGTFENPLPKSGKNIIVITNPNLSASPGFALGSYTTADSVSFTGSQSIGVVATGGGSSDYAYISFNSAFSTGDSISGTFTATWSGTAFDPTVVNQLNFYWGLNSQTIDSGTYLTSVSTAAVPEPSTSAFLAGGLIFAVGAIRRRKK